MWWWKEIEEEEKTAEDRRGPPPEEVEERERKRSSAIISIRSILTKYKRKFGSFLVGPAAGSSIRATSTFYSFF